MDGRHGVGAGVTMMLPCRLPVSTTLTQGARNGKKLLEQGTASWVYAIGEKQSVGENITITMYFRSYMEVPIHFALFFGSGRENKSTDKLILLIHLK